MLEAPLRGTTLPEVHSFVAQREMSALSQFQLLFEALNTADKDVVVEIFDAIVKAEVTGEQPPTFAHVPAAAKAVDFTGVTFIDGGGDLRFLSRMHCRVWNKYGAAGTGAVRVRGRMAGEVR